MLQELSIPGSLVVSILSSGTAVAVMIFVLKAIFEKYLERAFKRLELATEAELHARESNTSELFRSQLPVYAEVLEVIYRARNAARSCVESAEPPFSAIHDFGACRSHIVENLYKYRVFFDDPMFRGLHRYKSLIQEFGILLDEVTRSVDVQDSPVDEEVRQIARRQLSAKYKSLNALFEHLDSEVRAFLAEKTTFGAVVSRRQGV